jgi:hypothetical protein
LKNQELLLFSFGNKDRLGAKQWCRWGENQLKNGGRFGRVIVLEVLAGLFNSLYGKFSIF